MRVEEIETPESKKRYLLVDDEGEPIEPVFMFLRYKDNAGKGRNTLRAYCYHLKHFFEFLQQKEYDYRHIGLDEMAEFIRWLQTPHRDVKVATLKPIGVGLQASTINTYIGTVTEFYDYLMRHDDYSLKLSQKMKKQLPGFRKGFKDFLYHINKDRDFDSKILKLKVPKKRPKTISKDKIATLQGACSNLRDQFLLQLLWESGFRIGECLSLWIGDFLIDQRKIDLKDRGELVNGAEIKTVCSPRKIDVSSDLINMYMDYIAECHTDEVDTNHVFIKLSGQNKYQPMEYPDVTSLFLRLRKKTGIDVTPHMFRHSHFNTLRKQGWDFSKIRVRGGWSNVQTPIQIYSHPDEEEMYESWKKSETTMKLNKGTSESLEEELQSIFKEN
ncbi:tyrosine-type recombinase/integrase [Paenibacillus sp. FSL W8-1187]|uniref:tyrosine-type recombinase/integrase n=1 Tax=Paenibacillus sp. FSL W8-1187 TaxID=2975339 RepID=UPI0030D9AC0C